jgi:hypothetical protein
MNLAQAIAQRGINESRELAKLRARTRYHARLDRPKIWPCDRRAPSAFGNQVLARQFEASLATLQSTQKADEYVAAWCKLNWLKCD